MLKYHLTKEEMSLTFNKALQQTGVIDEQDSVIVFYDLAFMADRINNLKRVFPANTLHAVAAKANPLIRVLEQIHLMEVGLEVASLPELYLAEKAGFPAEKIVFDSPSKTKQELEYALKLGVHINADSFSELDRIGVLLLQMKSKSTIGVRLNPQVGAGSIPYLSVASSISKFGIPLNDHSEQLKEYFLKYSWLTGIHVHVGSQGCPVHLIVEGIRKVWDFAKAINQLFLNNSIERTIGIFDIGGGLPVSYDHQTQPVSMDEYQNILKDNFPELFDGNIKLITEFGRYIHANTGWVASRVEYVKREKNCNIIMTHVGADLLLRKCYHPDDWHHEINVTDKYGNLKTGSDSNKYMVAGPLCFSGDIIARDIELPVVEEGDYLLIHDTGAYTLSMWSRYNSRQIPKVMGYYGNLNHFKILREREDLKDLYEFWS